MSVRADLILPGQWSWAGRVLLREMINEKLKKRTRVGLVATDDWMQQTIFADSLLARMWLQLMNSVANDRITSCAACPKLFVDLPGARRQRRSDQRTCSDRCRKRLSRMKAAETQAKGGKRGKKTSKR